jgi:hypothetical protein
MGGMGVRVRATVHAAERFVERVRPGLDVAAGGRELERLVAEFGRIVSEPAWMPDAGRGATYVEISDGVVVAVQSGRAITVGVRSSMSPARRERLARARSADRHAKRYRNLASGGARGERAPVADEW